MDFNKNHIYNTTVTNKRSARDDNTYKQMK